MVSVLCKPNKCQKLKGRFGSGVRLWLKLDGTDVRCVLQENQRGKWEGEVNKTRCFGKAEGTL